MVARETSIAGGLAQMGLSGLPKEAIGRLTRFAELLRSEALPAGFLGPNEGDRLVSRHILEACALLPLVGSEGPLADVGSGAGIPGVVLACIRRGPATLIESHRRRAAFLRRALAELGLDAAVFAERAEDAGRTRLRETFDAVTARAVARPAVALELCLPLLRIGGVFASLVGEPEESGKAREEAEVQEKAIPDHLLGPARSGGRAGDGAGGGGHSPMGGLEGLGKVAGQLGGSKIELLGLEVPGADAARWVMIVRKLYPTSDRFPRRAGVPSRRPLG